jgi:hypothetical protein
MVQANTLNDYLCTAIRYLAEGLTSLWLELEDGLQIVIVKRWLICATRADCTSGRTKLEVP